MGRDKNFNSLTLLEKKQMKESLILVV